MKSKHDKHWRRTFCDLGGGLAKMYAWPMKAVLPDATALLALLTPEACSG